MTDPDPAIWIVDDDASVRRVLARALERCEMCTREFDAPSALREALGRGELPAVLVSDLRMPGESGLELLASVRAAHPELPVIIMTAYADLDNSVAALTGGAFELLPKPFDIDEAVNLVRRALAGRARISQDGGRQAIPGEPPSLIGSAPAMKELFRVIARLAGSDLGVLLIGESGTGKERIARALHETSRRAGEPFVALNVAAIPAELLESELFGHEKGAFSGASEARAGYFEQAAGGTLFLDEIGDMPAALQTRLLRVLADGDFRRLGGTRSMRADVRLIAATNRDLDRAVAEGRFRDDLYHRLNVVELRMPPLRDRRDDIPLLLAHYLAEAAREMNTEPKTLTAPARERLAAHAWPGNVRELVNLCRRLTALVPGPEIRAEDLPQLAPKQADVVDWTGALREWARARLAEGNGELMPEAVAQLERCLIDEALKATGGHRTEAARRLGIGRNTLGRKV
ncbi:MAG: nitrogen regulation protein NR(I) [Wenzhouxiangellaceae bacterium]|nr:nitrogen regulation protein NR(I) [Wenzhouxiangellaceae bacterium]MBS3824016.1 nitrogen regulation protein NR(I) [Wenzhouxiangellaceae bacterium]